MKERGLSLSSRVTSTLTSESAGLVNVRCKCDEDWEGYDCTAAVVSSHKAKIGGGATDSSTLQFKSKDPLLRTKEEYASLQVLAIKLSIVYHMLTLFCL